MTESVIMTFRSEIPGMIALFWEKVMQTVVMVLNRVIEVKIVKLLYESADVKQLSGK